MHDSTDPPETGFIPHNFAALPPELSARETAAAVIVPVPYDLTTSYVPGTRFGPRALIEASAHLELFDDELGCEPATAGIHTMAELEPVTAGPEHMIAAVEEVVAGVTAAGQLPIVIGGEHSISLGAVRAVRQSRPQCCVLQLDAHADLRDAYQGSPFNHACAGRRMHELCPLTQVGVRSLSLPEQRYRESSDITTFFARDIVGCSEDWITQCVDTLAPEVYLTIDLDVLDPSLMPAVGTPEPGGLGWFETLALLRAVCRSRHVIGFDIVELCPQPGNPAPNFTAAKLCYKLLGYVCS